MNFKELDNSTLFDFFCYDVKPWLVIHSSLCSLHSVFEYSRLYDNHIYSILSAMWYRYWGKEYLRSFFRKRSKFVSR